MRSSYIFSSKRRNSSISMWKSASSWRKLCHDSWTPPDSEIWMKTWGNYLFDWRFFPNKVYFKGFSRRSKGGAQKHTQIGEPPNTPSPRRPRRPFSFSLGFFHNKSNFSLHFSIRTIFIWKNTCFFASINFSRLFWPQSRNMYSIHFARLFWKQSRNMHSIHYSRLFWKQSRNMYSIHYSRRFWKQSWKIYGTLH